VFHVIDFIEEAQFSVGVMNTIFSRQWYIVFEELETALGQACLCESEGTRNRKAVE
jgi:hypothetical protein